MVSLLWLITILLAALWLLGYAVNIGAWVNVLLVFAVALLVVNIIGMLVRRPTVVERDVHEVHDHTHDHHVRD